MTELTPAQIYVAGDLSDLHGTHRIKAEAILAGLSTSWPAREDPEVWLMALRGGRNIRTIDRRAAQSRNHASQEAGDFRTNSQKDAALFPANDGYEFWVRAEERTKETARIYNALGLPEFHALESFKRYDGMLG
ncbi:MAG: hypothetical protein KF861_01000 [Planctomycetaceae bacterium]|nr:hypothetical protein [Planctomycetaceae bacterium]